MPDRYSSYAALAAARVEGVDYSRTAVSPVGATWASIAIHGGSIEAGSGEVARDVAGVGLRFYEFAGLLDSGNRELHLTSSRFDEPMALDVVGGAMGTLSFHGYAGTAGVAETAIGGLDRVAVQEVATALRRAGFQVVDALGGIAGDHPANVCNRNSRSAGVQLEMSRALRAGFFPRGDLSQRMRDSGRRTDSFRAYVAAVRSVVADCGALPPRSSLHSSRW
ncbi:poly-gamma-glutamate hydrolase family protein [Streptomyces sp. NPDC059256]|uniref:poly-gamma-glutamate hydrolase family protein n=1 Tax=Streptomyces sp. NPDC059256 TaxID=3346794 RepID=UPI0036BF08C2